MRFARASLKPRGGAELPQPVLGLSRAFCAGLIEARAIRFPSGAGSCGYPVRFARASLKRPAPSAAGSGGRSYPVRFARASLKRQTRSATRRRRRELSRAFCAGLIEAAAGAATARPSAWLSRAFCAGLIEAARSGQIHVGSRSRYPVRFARASLKPRQGELVAPEILDVIPCVLRGPH